MLQYKKMEATDVPELAGLYIEAFNAPPWNDKWTRETAEKRLHQMICVEDFYGLCAYQEDQLCGMILGCMEQFYDGVTFNLREFCIRNELRGSGIGTELLGHFEEALKEMGVKEIILFTSRGLATEHFYQKQGYHNLDGLVLMEKHIR